MEACTYRARSGIAKFSCSILDKMGGSFFGVFQTWFSPCLDIDVYVDV